MVNMEILTKKNRKSFKGILAVGLSIILAVTAPGSVVNGKTGTPSLTATKVSLVKGKTKTITIQKNGAAVKKVTWKSSNKKIATVKAKGKLKGTITAVKKGTATITAAVSYKKGKKTASKKLTCKVAVKDASAKATDFSFVLEDDGDCIVGVSPVTVSFVLDKTSSNVNLKVIRYGLDEIVFEQTYKACEKGKKISYEISSFDKSGLYYATVQVGDEITKTSLFSVIDQLFAGGNGSAKNPYKIQTLEQLKKMQGSNGKRFVQIADIDFSYNDITSIFGETMPFVGNYDGDGYSFKNFYGTGSIFGYIGENAIISNLKLDNCICTADYASILAYKNEGMISSCSFTNCTVQGEHNAAIGVSYNHGKVLDCTFEGTASLKFGAYENFLNCAAGVVAVNKSSGLIRNCKAKVDVSATAPNYPCAAVISGLNEGIIESCETSGIVEITRTNNYGGIGRWAGIVALNRGIVRSCSYNGNVSELVAENDGGTIN